MQGRLKKPFFSILYRHFYTKIDVILGKDTLGVQNYYVLNTLADLLYSVPHIHSLSVWVSGSMLAL